jgi:EAL domain-containing protein (putative c-di-GMP-specific phosphodiesterase class I)
MQGFLFSKPLPAGEIEKLCREHVSQRAHGKEASAA